MILVVAGQHSHLRERERRGGGRESERDRERERGGGRESVEERDRERERQRGGETERVRERQRERRGERESERERETLVNKHAPRDRIKLHQRSQKMHCLCEAPARDTTPRQEGPYIATRYQGSTRPPKSSLLVDSAWRNHHIHLTSCM